MNWWLDLFTNGLAVQDALVLLGCQAERDRGDIPLEVPRQSSCLDVVPVGRLTDGRLSHAVLGCLERPEVGAAGLNQRVGLRRHGRVLDPELDVGMLARLERWIGDPGLLDREKEDVPSAVCALEADLQQLIRSEIQRCDRAEPKQAATDRRSCCSRRPADKTSQPERDLLLDVQSHRLQVVGRVERSGWHVVRDAVLSVRLSHAREEAVEAE